MSIASPELQPPLPASRPQAEAAATRMQATRRAMASVIEVGARLLALAAIVIFFGTKIGPGFYSAGNIESILIQSAVYAMGGLGMTMIIITGGIDLAAGSTIALAMVVTTMVLNHPGTDVWYWQALAVLGGVASAVAVGAIQGSLITGLRIVPFIVTLGGLVTVRGFVKYVADNQEINPTPGWLYRHLMFQVQGGQFNWQLFPFGVWATLIAAIIAAAMLRYTKFGRRIYAIGSNEATARLCGIPVQRTKLLVYAVGGLFFGLAGVLEFSRLNIGQPTGAMMYELYIIAACVIGGTSLSGGVGSIFGTIIGALIIGVLYAGAGQAGWEKSVQEMAIGVIIIAAVALDQLRTRKTR